VSEKDGDMAIIGSGEHQVQTSFVFITRFIMSDVQEWLTRTLTNLALMYNIAVASKLRRAIISIMKFIDIGKKLFKKLHSEIDGDVI
jgi:hypothetical protein